MRFDQKPVFRFAPSPNGELHLGHAYSALLNQALARECGGRLLLRIEDIDTQRCTPKFEAQMLEDLTWLGFEWDGEPRRQSEHFEDYVDALATLKDEALVYPAFLSRGEIRHRVERAEEEGEIWPRDPDGAAFYPAEERSKSTEEMEAAIDSGKPFAWRLDMTAATLRDLRSLSWTEWNSEEEFAVSANPAIWGDVVIARSDVPTSYHLSVVVDDAIEGITHVVRGRDLYEATAVHRLLQNLLGLPEPVYHHHPLVLAEDGRKLSKSNRDTSIRALREAGATPNDIRRMVGLDKASVT